MATKTVAVPFFSNLAFSRPPERCWKRSYSLFEGALRMASSTRAIRIASRVLIVRCPRGEFDAFSERFERTPIWKVNT